MAIIKKKIENLKPGRDYLISVRTKNPDLNVYSESSNSILVSIPKDTTIPDAISSLALYASFQNVMFVFNFSNDLDIDKYEYELYNNQAGTGTPTSAGFNAANVFTVAVPNSTSINGVTVAKSYWGRVRSVDTTGNLGPWTVLVQTDQSTPLINNQYISDLTASKITAGTIGAHTITLAGTNSILKSNNYAAATANTGGAGWKISGDGKVVFNDASIRSSLDIGEDQGTSDATSFHVDANGNMWSGANSSSFSTAPFKVNNTGNVTADSLTLTGLTEMATGSKIFLGAGNYNNIDTGFYVDSSSNFSLGNKLTWDGTDLTVQGTLKLSDGSDVLNADDVNDILEEAVYVDGFIGGLTISGTKMYYGTGTFSNQNTAFYVAKNITSGQADFSLGNKLTWDGATLNITGNIVITGGSTLNLINDAQSDADNAQADADNAQATASSAGTTAQNAYNTANTKITAGYAAFDINNNATTISGDKIKTGQISSNNPGVSWINLDDGRFSFGNGKIHWDGSTLSVSGDISGCSGTFSGNLSSAYIDGGTVHGATIRGGSILVDGGGDIKCDTGTLRVGTNRGLQSDGTFATTTSTTTCRVHSFGSYGSEVFREPASRRELKENIKDISGATAILKKLRPRIFNWKIDAHDPVDPTTGAPWTDDAKAINEFNKAFGFIAEEVAEDYPALALYSSPRHLPSEDPQSFFDIASWIPAMWKDMDMIPLLVKAVQELSAKVEELESRLS